jgi:hypothetical protein
MTSGLLTRSPNLARNVSAGPQGDFRSWGLTGRANSQPATAALDPYVWSGPGDPGELVSERNRQHCGLINAPLPRSFPTDALLKLQE